MDVNRQQLQGLAFILEKEVIYACKGLDSFAVLCPFTAPPIPHILVLQTLDLGCDNFSSSAKSMWQIIREARDHASKNVQFFIRHSVGPAYTAAGISSGYCIHK